MPRIGISYDQVSAVADAMVAEGITPTIRNVRDRLGTGSCNTIHKHLTTLREACPQLVAVTTEIPASIINAFGMEIVRAKAEARAEIENRLVLIQAEASELAVAGEILESELDKHMDELSALATDRDILLEKNQGQSLEIERLSRDNERERHSADQSRIEVAQLRNKLEILEERLMSQLITIDELKAANASDLLGKISAEKDAAVLAARLKAEQEKAMTLQLEKEALTTQIATERQSSEAARMETTKVTSELTNQTAVLAQKVSDFLELSAVYEREKNARIANEKAIEVLQEQLTTERKSLESARSETARKADELVRQSVALEREVSALRELTGFYESEKSGRIAAELKISTLVSQLKEQDMTDISSPQAAS